MTQIPSFFLDRHLPAPLPPPAGHRKPLLAKEQHKSPRNSSAMNTDELKPEAEADELKPEAEADELKLEAEADVA